MKPSAAEGQTSVRGRGSPSFASRVSAALSVRAAPRRPPLPHEAVRAASGAQSLLHAVNTFRFLGRCGDVRFWLSERYLLQVPFVLKGFTVRPK